MMYMYYYVYVLLCVRAIMCIYYIHGDVDILFALSIIFSGSRSQQRIVDVVLLQ